MYDGPYGDKEALLPNPNRLSVSKELKTIVRSVGSIGDALARIVPLLAKASANGAHPVPGIRAPRKLRLSPERRAALKIQGQYMGYLRGLQPRQKARVKALAASKGVRAAVGLARRLARS